MYKLASLSAICFATTCAHAATYNLIDLGTIRGSSSQAYGINSTGQIIGSSLLSGSNTSHAFLYSGTSMQDLNGLLDVSGAGYVVSNAAGIADNGYVCGTAIFGGTRHAVLLKPIAVPEPMSQSLLGLGALALVRKRRNA